MKHDIAEDIKAVFKCSVDDGLFRYSYLWLINFAILTICYFPALNLRFSPDSYFQLYRVNDGAILSGRIVAYLIDKFLRLFSHPILQQQWFFWIYIALLTSSHLIIIKTFNLLYQFQNVYNLFICNIIFISGFANVIMQELVAYPENYVTFGIGMLACLTSVYYFIRMLEYNRPNSKYLLDSIVTLFISLQCYQIYITVWCTLIVIFLVLKNKSILCKTFFCQGIKAFLVFAVDVVLILFTSKALVRINIMSENRYISVSSIAYNINTIKSSISTWLRYPRNYLIGIVLYLIIAWQIIGLILNVKKIEHNFLQIILFTLVGLTITFGFHLFMSNIWLVPRVLIGMGFTMMGVMLIVCLQLQEQSRIIPVLLLGITLLINVYYMQGAIINEYALNRVDQNECQEILGCIKDYELKNDIEIQYIGFCNDDSPTWQYYNNIKYNYGDAMSRILMVEWSRIPMLNYYGRRKFTPVEVPDYIYYKYFRTKDWNYFNTEEQLVFDGNVLYICNY